MKELEYELTKYATLLGAVFLLWLIFVLFVTEDNQRNYLRGEYL